MSLEEQPRTLFHADILAPYQFASPSGQSREPEARLMMAILGDAPFCLQKYQLAPDKQGQKIFAEEDWLLDNGDCWPLAFVDICGVLGISPGYLRRKLMRWKEAQMRPVLKRSRASLKLCRSA